jgi:hypothetical protein
MEKALARLTKRQRTRVERHAQVERELAQVQQRLDRLIDALADGSLPTDEIKTRLSTEKARICRLTSQGSSGWRRSRASTSRRSLRSSAPGSAT